MKGTESHLTNKKFVTDFETINVKKRYLLQVQKVSNDPFNIMGLSFSRRHLGSVEAVDNITTKLKILSSWKRCKFSPEER